jgi:hypothetical protein
MQKSREEPIRDRAFALWEAEGRPEGKDAEHWYQAERDLREGSIEGPAEGTALIDGSAPDERADPLEKPESETLRTHAEPGRPDAPDSLPRSPLSEPD